MEILFRQDYWLVWALALGLALFFPVRNLIWALMVRRAERKQPTDEAERRRLRKRAAATAGLLCFVFAVVFTKQLFQGRP